MLALLLASLVSATPLKTVNFGSVRVSFAIGDVLDQGLPVVAASHARDTVAKSEGVAGEVYRRGGAGAIEQFAQIVQRTAPLAYGSVHPVSIPYNHQLHSVFLFNVITHDPLAPLTFTRVEQLESARDLPFRPEEIANYARVLRILETLEHKSPNSWDWVHYGRPALAVREEILRPYAVGLGFTHVTHAVTNMLEALTLVDRAAVAVGPLGAGRSGPLDLQRSIEAVLAGAKAYAFAHAEEARPLEVRYAILDVERRDLLAMIDRALVEGRFLTSAGEFGVDGTDWAAARADFVANELAASLTPAAPSVGRRVMGRCAGVISNVSARVNLRILK